MTRFDALRAAGARALVALLVCAAFGLPRVSAADDHEHAVELVEAAIAALGGQKYLAVKTSVATGVFTGFVSGQRTVPLEFTDTFVYPDKNRTEFGRKKTKVVQSNAGDHGWKYDGARELLEAQSEEEIRQFQRFVRANIDNILRTNWRQPGVQLHAIQRTEIAPRVWTEGVAVEYDDGLRVEIFFDPSTHLPRLSRYREGAESGAAGSLAETRYHDVYFDFDGVKVPRVVDLYRDGAQTARLVYEDVQFNVSVDPQFFEQPASAKDLK